MTKKSLIMKILVCVLAIAVISVSVVGCTFIRENDDRVANQAYAVIKNPNGVSVELSYNELMDYFNSWAYTLVNYYGYSVEDALDYCIENKIKSKYFLTEAMAYLASGDASKVDARRTAVLYGSGAKQTVEQVLTIAERYAAIFAVNESIESQLKTAETEAYQEELDRIEGEIGSENVKEIKFTAETETYLEEFFVDGECLAGATIDTDKIKVVVVYDNGSVSDAYIVPTKGYSTAFSSELTKDSNSGTVKTAANSTEDKTFVISFTENKTVDGEIEDEEHTLTYEYKLRNPRATKTKVEETKAQDIVTIDEEDVSRYATDAQIPASIKNKCQLKDLNAEYEAAKKAGNEPYKIEAYRVTIENMKTASKDMAYFYHTQYESAALTALQAEVYAKVDATLTAANALDAEIVAEYKYLYENAKNGYNGKDAEATEDAFITAIDSNLSTFYYYPAVTDIADYYYVYQILFNYTDAQAALFNEMAADDDDAAAIYHEYLSGILKTKGSNPDYDPEYDCPLHELHEDNATCSCTEGLCPSIAYQPNEELVADVLTELQSELTGKTGADAVEVFERYMYTYNDDAGIMNKTPGYLIYEDNGFYESFNDLADSVYAYSPEVGNAFDAAGHLAVGYTPYGVHIIMVSATPFAGIASDTELTFDWNNTASVVDYLKKKYDANGNSLYETLKKNLTEEKHSLSYNKLTETIPSEIYERDEETNKITLNKDLKKVITLKDKKIKEIYDTYLGNK